MGGYPKIDYPPLLAPGRHYMTLQEIQNTCVEPFFGEERAHRKKLFYALEEFIQKLLVARIRCDVFLDGSFVTRKPFPDDVDVIVSTELAGYERLSEEQLNLLDSVNRDGFILGVQSFSMVRYPREHERFGSAADLGNAGEAYGVEHGQQWLKGYIVIRLWETDVGNRICR